MIKSVKRLGAAVLSAVMMLTAVATPLCDNLPIVSESVADVASAETYGNFQYSVLDDGTVCITNWGNPNYTVGENCEIPSVIDGKTVTTIDSRGFCYDSTPPKYISIPETVTYINENIFIWTYNYISDITVSDNNKNYSSVDGVLYNKDKTELIYYPGGKCGECVIPKSVKYIHDLAFRDNDNITLVSVETGNNYYTVENGILFTKDKTKLVKYPCQLENTSYNVPDSVIDIGGWAFYGNGNISSINFTDSIKSIGECCFDNCENIELTSIPRKIEYLGGYAFGGRLKLQTLIMPKTLSKFGLHAVAARPSRYAFYNCQIENVIYEDGTTTLDSSPFEYCYSLKSVTIPKSVTKIYSYNDALGFMYGQKIDNFKIYCYSGTAGEKYAKDNGLAYELLDKPTIANVTGFKVKSLTSTNVTLQWNKNANASGYEIEQYKSGKWTNVAKITSNATTSYTVKGLAAGTAGYKFRMRAVRDGAYSDYTSVLTVNTNPYGVSGFKCSSKTSTSVTLKWNKGTTASGYQLQQYKDGKWVTIYTGTKATDTSYTVKKLKAGTAGYRFRIRAYKTYGNAKQYGSWSSEVKVNTNPYGVGGFKCSSKSSTSVTLKWNKGTTASGYQLQQYKDGKWVTIYTGTKATNTSYTVKGLKAGTAGYRFRIRAYKTYGNTKQYGSWSSEVKVNTNPYGVGGFKCSSKSSTSVTLKWNKGTTASGYQLQQYKDGKWVTIYTGTKATNTSYTVKKLKAGTAGYRFRIRAYKTYGSSKQYGSWSSEVKVNTNPYGVGGFKAKSTAKTSITLGWNKGTTASGYQLQQYKGGKWVTVYTGTKATSTSYTVKSLKANTSYKFRIRAYKTYGNTKQYGSWSKELTVRTKR